MCVLRHEGGREGGGEGGGEGQRADLEEDLQVDDAAPQRLPQVEDGILDGVLLRVQVEDLLVEGRRGNDDVIDVVVLRLVLHLLQGDAQLLVLLLQQLDVPVHLRLPQTHTHAHAFFRAVYTLETLSNGQTFLTDSAVERKIYVHKTLFEQHAQYSLNKKHCGIHWSNANKKDLWNALSLVHSDTGSTQTS